MAIGYLLADEFRTQWKTYALVEWMRPDGEDAWDAVQRLDGLTQYLGSLNEKGKAAKLLGDWLSRNKDRSLPMWPRFMLRRILYLQESGSHTAAVAALEDLLKDHDNYPSLHCLYGNLLAYQKRFDDAFRAFDKAISLDDNWAEPHLEKIDNLIVRNMSDEVVEHAQYYLSRVAGDPRATLILKANLLIARTLTERGYLVASKPDQEAISQIAVPDYRREKWNFKGIRKHLKGLSPEKCAALEATADDFHELGEWTNKLEPLIDVRPL